MDSSKSLSNDDVKITSVFQRKRVAQDSLADNRPSKIRRNENPPKVTNLAERPYIRLPQVRKPIKDLEYKDDLKENKRPYILTQPGSTNPSMITRLLQNQLEQKNKRIDK